MIVTSVRHTAISMYRWEVSDEDGILETGSEGTREGARRAADASARKYLSQKFLIEFIHARIPEEWPGVDVKLRHEGSGMVYIIDLAMAYSVVPPDKAGLPDVIESFVKWLTFDYIEAGNQFEHPETVKEALKFLKLEKPYQYGLRVGVSFLTRLFDTPDEAAEHAQEAHELQPDDDWSVTMM